eukprot:CAMPEP_0118923676 /NCGR_PEP_ID=MMETSP1169-20130426/2112_1 /TAXON_ID=36882 /ORGANISM="Pyramimonas obovata, Strain CCMP722" /LENGTH=288 /DNA_ID=CAMNT_0006864693 /DNA_START=191 /DNA_END=1057 /DNA_ORIENTATION=+
MTTSTVGRINAVLTRVPSASVGTSALCQRRGVPTSVSPVRVTFRQARQQKIGNAVVQPFGGKRSLRVSASSDAAADAEPKKRVLVPIADGTEEIEAVTVIDVLRRAGAEVVVASVEPGRKQVVCSRGVRIEADIEVNEVAGRGAPTWDMIAIPGGMPGAEHISDHIKLHSVLQKHFQAGRPLGGICAAPAIVFEQKGFLEGYAATAHPAFVDELGGSLQEKTGYEKARVLVDQNIITSRGPGTSLEWALCLVEQLFGKEKAEEVAEPMVVQPLNPRQKTQFEWRLNED